MKVLLLVANRSAVTGLIPSFQEAFFQLHIDGKVFIVAAYWARSQAVHEGIKALYIDYKSIKKMKKNEKEDILNYIKVKDYNREAYDIKMKFKILKWASFHCPIICKIYGNLRFQQEYLKGKI